MRGVGAVDHLWRGECTGHQAFSGGATVIIVDGGDGGLSSALYTGIVVVIVIVAHRAGLVGVIVVGAFTASRAEETAPAPG